MSPCHLEGFEEEVLCGTYRVWENRAARSGRMIDLQVAVVPAVRREQSLIRCSCLPGTRPGRPDYGQFIPAAFKEVHRQRDIVLVDLRGTGASNPLDCALGDPLTSRICRGDRSPRPVSRARAEGGPRLYTNEPAVDDLDDVRAALGYERINLWGGSYGTRAALVYARRHPDRVRSVILDGAAPFEIKLPLYNAWGAQRALDRLTGRLPGGPECRAAFPRFREELARCSRGSSRSGAGLAPPSADGPAGER